jgi:hypothetical protein
MVAGAYGITNENSPFRPDDAISDDVSVLHSNYHEQANPQFLANL